MRNIISKVKSGDKDSFSDLYRMYYPKIYSFVNKIMKNKALTEEITQEVFFRLWVNHQSLDETISYDSYFFTIAKNISMDIYRKNTIETNYHNYQQSRNFRVSPQKAAKDDRHNVTAPLFPHFFHFSDLQKLIDEAVDKMPKQQQIVFRLSRTDGLLNEEIAQKLGISKRTVEKHISNSLKVIKVIVKNNYMLLFM